MDLQDMKISVVIPVYNEVGTSCLKLGTSRSLSMSIFLLKSVRSMVVLNTTVTLS